MIRVTRAGGGGGSADLTLEDPHVVGEVGEPPFATRAPFQEYETFRIVGDPGEPAYENSWSGDASFALSNLGNARIISIATNAGSSATVFTLPAGYRPATQQVFSNFTVETDGQVLPTGSQTAIDFGAESADGTVFPADGAPVAPDVPSMIQRDPPIAFYKDGFGIVHLQGSAEYGTPNPEDIGLGQMFTLPVGYRPEAICGFPMAGYDTDDEGWKNYTWICVVHPDGLVEMISVASPGNDGGSLAREDNSPVLDGISFRAA